MGGKKIYCAHGLCTSNNIDKEVGVKLLPFPKPCTKYIESALINNTNDHNPKQCAKCAKCLRWIHLCKRSDSHLTRLLDVSRRTMICTKHFPNGLGPTELDPDPYPADAGLKPHKPSRRAPTDRSGLPIHPTKKRRLTSSSVPTAEFPIATECNTNEMTTASKTASVMPPIFNEPSFEASTWIVEESTFIYDHEYAKPVERENGHEFTLKQIAHKLVDQNLHVKCDCEMLIVSFNRDHLVEKSCTVDREFNVQVFILGKPICEENIIWKKYPRTWDKDFDFISFFKDLALNWFACQSYVDSHWIAKVKESPNSSASYQYDRITDSVRSLDCTLLGAGHVCFNCKKMIRNFQAKTRKRPFLTCRRISNMSREEAQAKLRRSQVKLAQEKHKSRRLILKLKRLISGGTVLSSSDSSDFLNILRSDNSQSSDIAKLFFAEQIKAAKVKSAKGHRWHPLIIKWCLYLKSKSASTYSALRKVITLPSEKRLYQVQTLTHVKPGFHQDVLDSIVKEFDAAGPEEHRRYCSLVMDEIKIQEDLVYKGSTGDLIGFVQLSDVDQLLNQIESEANGTRKTDQPLATHVLQLMVRGISSSVDTTYAYFATKTLKSSNLFAIVLEAITNLEEVDIRVLALVSDGAAANRSMYKMFTKGEGKDSGPQWCTENVLSYDERKLYFVCDAPHLLKTTRNAFANSGCHKKSRLLWKDGHHIQWKHVVEAYKADLSSSFRILHHISHDHLYLTPTSLMKVKFAVQVLSKRMATAVAKMDTVGGERRETVKFIETFNKFFDLMNTRNLLEGLCSRNPDVNAYTDPEDERLTWLNEEFLKYLEDWKTSVEERPGNFTNKQRQKMLLSKETLEGLFITVKSVTALVRFMLKEGAHFVLTEKFNQDKLEMNFSKQRGASGANTNPSLQKYGDNFAKLKCLKEHAYLGKGNITH